MGNIDLKRAAFIKHFLNAIDNPDVIVMVQDEAGLTITLTLTILGFGGYSSHLRKYAYAIRGLPAIHPEKKLKENLTLTAFISKHGIEGF